MKKIANIVAILLGVAFIIFGLSFFVPAIKSVLPAPSAPSSPEAGALTQANFTAMTGTSYLAIIKALEVIGGLLLLRACSRGWGVALIGAITFNIVLVCVLIKQVYDPVAIILAVAVLFLAWVGHRLKELPFVTYADSKRALAVEEAGESFCSVLHRCYANLAQR